MARIFKVLFLPVGFGLIVQFTGCAAPVKELTSQPANTTNTTETASTPTSAAVAAPTKKSEVVKKDAKPVANAAKLSPDLLYRLLLGEIAGQRGQLEIALQQYMKAARASHHPQVVERATRIAVFARDDAAALEAALIWIELDPNSLDAHQVASAMYLRQGKVSEAKQHLRRVVDLSDAGADKFMLVTSLLGKEKDKQIALTVMEELIADRKDDPDALYAYAQLAVLVGELNKAREAAEKVRQLRPEMTEGHILYSNILTRQGLKNEAFDALRQSLAEQPNNHTLRQHYARRLVDEKQYTQAREQYKLLVEVMPESHETLYALGLLGLQVRDVDDAQKYFNTLIQINQMVSESNYYLGQIAETRNDSAAAVQAYEEVTSGQHYLEAQIRIALIESRAGDLNKARLRLQELQGAAPESEIRLILAESELLLQHKQDKEVFEFLNNALSKHPDNAQLLYARALAAEKVERMDVTLADLTTIVQRDPANVQALNALGYTLVDRTDRLSEGMAYIQRAYKQQPDDPAIIDSMGWAHYRTGNHKEALKFLKMAFEKMKDAEVAAHLGEVLWVTGEREQARHIWDEALRDTPSHKALLDVIKRFTK